MIKIAIHGVPRSGTTWVGEIINSSPNVVYRYQPLFSYALKGFLDESQDCKCVDNFYRRLINVDDDFMNQIEARSEGLLPRFNKSNITHVAYKEVRYHNILSSMVSANEDIRFILLLRNPMAVINSWLHAPKEFRAELGWSPLGEWRFAEKKNQGRMEEFNGYEQWKSATSLFIKLESDFPDRVMCLHYGSMLGDRFNQAKRLFEFTGLSWNPQTESFLEQSLAVKNVVLDPYSVMKCLADDRKWENQLNIEIIRAIQEDLAGSSLEFLISEH